MKGILGLVSVWVLVVCEICNVQIQRNWFLGGSSLHLNHLLAQCMTNYDWPFGTRLDFFCHIWTQWTLRHILGPILVIFEICHFLTIPGPFEYFSANG